MRVFEPCAVWRHVALAIGVVLAPVVHATALESKFGLIELDGAGNATLGVGQPLLALAADARVRIHEGQDFVAARKVLLKDRWRPIPMHREDGYEYEGVEKHLIKRGFNEVDSCSIDSSRCILFYKKAGRCLRVDTIGEQVAIMKVVQWSHECPDAPPRQAD